MSYAANRYGDTRPHRRAAVGLDTDNLLSRQPVKRNSGKVARDRGHRKQRQLSNNQIIGDASRDIHRTIRQQVWLYAMNIKDAVRQLTKRLKKHSPNAIAIAFRKMVKADIVIYDDRVYAYRLAA